MKSISQIFINNKELLDNAAVDELIEYCRSLEDKVIENKQSKNFSFENKLTELVRDIYMSVEQEIKRDEESIRFRETERVDYEQCMKNLKKYLLDFSKENKFNLHG